MHRLYQRLIIFLFGGTLLLTALFFFRHPLLSPYINELLVEQARTHLGLDIAIGRVSGTYLSGLELAEVRTVGGEPKTPLTGVEVGRIRIRYSLLSFLAGPDSFLTTTRISLDDAFLKLDVTHNGEQEAGLLLPPQLPSLIVRNTSIHIRTGKETVQLNGLTANVYDLKNKTGKQEVALNIEQTIFPFPGLAPDPHTIGLNLLYSRESITVTDFQIDQKSVTQTAHLDLHEMQHGRMAFAADLLMFAGKIRLQGMIDNSLLEARLTGRDINLEAFPDFLKKPQFKVGGLANGQIDFTLDPADIVNLTGSLNLQVQKGRLRDFVVPQVDLKASVAEGYVRLQQLLAKFAGTHLALHNTAVPVAVLLAGKADDIINELSGGFSVNSQDIGSVLSATGILTSEQDRVLPPQFLTATGSVEGGYCQLDTLAGRLGNNRLDLEEVSFPLKDVLFPRTPYQWISSTRGNFSLKAQNIQDLAVLTGHAKVLPESTGLPDHTLTLAGHLQDGSLTLAHGTLNSNGMVIALHDETVITIPPPDISLENIAVRSDLDMQISELSLLTTLFGLEPVHGSLQGRIKLDGPLSGLNGSLHIDATDIQFSTLRVASLQTRARAHAGKIIVDRFEAQTDEDRLDGHGSFSIDAQRINELSLQVAVKEIDSYLAGFVPPNHHIQGGLVAGLEASGPWSGPEVKLQARFTEGHYQGIAISEAVLLLVLSNRHLDVKEAYLSTSEGRLTVTGTLARHEDDRDLDVTIRTLALERNEAKLSLEQPVELSFVGPGTVIVDKLTLTGNIGRIEADGLLQIPGDSDLHIQFVGLTGNGWLSPQVADRLYFNGADFTCNLTGDIGSPTIRLQGTVAQLGSRYTPNPFSGIFDVVIDKQGLDFRKFQWTGQKGLNMIAINGRLPLRPIDFEPLADIDIDLVAQLELPDLSLVSTMLPSEFAAKGSLHGKLSLHGTMDMPTVRLRLTAGRVVLPPTLKYLPPGPFDLNCDLHADPGRYSFSTLRLTAPSLILEAAGDWLAPPSFKEIITDPQSLRLTGVLDMTARLAVSDFSWTAKHIEAIRRLDGRLDMEATLAGPVEKPTLQGTIRLADGELRSSYAIPSVRDMQMAVGFEADRIDIDSLTGELGGAPFTVTGEVRDYTSVNPTIDLVFKGENLLFHRSDGMNIRSDADLKFQGELNRLSVSGDLAITDGRFTKKFDFLHSITEPTKPQRTQGLQLFSLKEPPLSRAGLAVKIQTKKGFLIKNNLAQGSLRPDLLLSGTGELPVLQGTVYLDPIKVKLPSGFLTIESGLIRFTETEPDRPQVDMTGTAMIMGYEITMLINGFIDEPTVTLSSSPPLPDDELLLLVLTGNPPKSSAGSLQKSSMNVAVYLGRSVLDDWFKSNGTETDDSILERFELEIGRGITRRGEETVDAQFRLAENVFRDDDILFITAQKDVYDYINAGMKIVFRFQ